MEIDYEDSGNESRFTSTEERSPTPSPINEFLAFKLTTIVGTQNEWKQDKKSKRCGRIMVSIGNSAPAISSTLLYSDPIQISGLHWRLQIILNRNPLTGQSRFISLVIICEDCPIGDTLTTIIKCRLISHLEGSCGEREEIIGKFNWQRRHVSISNFYEFGKIFKEGSEFICEQIGNEAQIEAKIYIIAREREQICRIDRLLFFHSIPQQPFQQQFDSATTKLPILQEKRVKLAKSLDWILKKEKQNEEGETEEDEIGIFDKENYKRGKQRRNHWGKKMKKNLLSAEAKDATKITAFFPSRRSSRLPAGLVNNILLSNLETHIKMAMNEPFLEIFKSPIKGRGLRTKKNFKKDEFVVEYKGEVLNMENAKKRELAYAKNSRIGCYMFYFKHNDTKWCIDATKECAANGKGRLVNHSKLAPNMKAKVFDLVDDEHPHLCLIALRDIQIGEELTFDYGDRTPLIVEKNPWLLNT